MNNNKIKKIEERLSKISEDIIELKTQIRLMSNELNVNLSKKYQVGLLYKPIDRIVIFCSAPRMVLLSIMWALHTILFGINIYRKGLDFSSAYIYFMISLGVMMLFTIGNDQRYAKIVEYIDNNKIIIWCKR